MRNHAQSPLKRHPAHHRLRKVLPVENHDCAGIHVSQQKPDLARDVPRRKDVLTEKIARGFIVVEVVPAQNPAQGGKAESTKGQSAAVLLWIV